MNPVVVRLAAVFVLFLIASGCVTEQKGVLVNVTVPPQMNLKVLSEDIQTVNLKSVSGESNCAVPLKSKIDELVTNAGVFKKEIGGFEESSSAAIDVQGKVEKCSLDMGYGSLTASFTIIYQGQAWRSFNISKDTNRPGASTGEVRDVLVDRVAKQFVSMFVPTTKQELREFKPLEAGDPGMTAALNSNWDVAIELWSKKVRKTPSDHLTIYDRGVAYEARGDLKKAIADYQKALSLQKNDLYAQALARARNALKAFEEKEGMKAK